MNTLRNKNYIEQEEHKRLTKELFGDEDNETMASGGTVMENPRLFKTYINTSNYNKRITLIRRRNNDYLGFFVTADDNYHIGVYEAEKVKEWIKDSKWQLAKLHSGSMREHILIKISEIARDIVNEKLDIETRLKDSYLGEKSKKEVQEFVEIMKSDKTEFSDGGVIPNNYEGKTAEEVWGSWDYEQRRHFLSDHFSNEQGPSESGKTFDADKSIELPYDKLPMVIVNEIRNHVAEGQYKKGGNITEPYVIVGVKDGYWIVITKPVSKEWAEEHFDLFTVPRGETKEIKKVLEVKAHKKVIGAEYLEGVVNKIDEATTGIEKEEALTILKALLLTLKGKEKKECLAKIKELEKEPK